jgi:chromosomal replication initiator protein
MTCIAVEGTQLSQLADAIKQRVGAQRFSVWFTNSTRLELKGDELEIAVPNDFISEWIAKNFTLPIQEAAREVLGGPLTLHFQVVPQVFAGRRNASNEASVSPARPSIPTKRPITSLRSAAADPAVLRLRHDLDSFVVGPSNQIAHNAAICVATSPGAQYNPLFIHGNCGLGKTHLLQGLVRKFADLHPTKHWLSISGEEFTNDFLTALRTHKVDAFRRRMREVDLLAIDDVHFLAGKHATLEEFLHTFNHIEASGRQVVLVSDNHPKLIKEFGESLVNRFISGMVVRIDPPNLTMRSEILSKLATRAGVTLDEPVIQWIARRVTQNVRELAGAINRIAAQVRHNGQHPTLELAQQCLGDLDRAMIAPVKPENILTGVCQYFGLERRELMSGRRQRTISLARSIAMYLVRKTARLSFPEIGACLGKRNHSTVISACRRIEKAVSKNEPLSWTSTLGQRCEEAVELIQRLEEHCRAMV